VAAVVASVAAAGAAAGVGYERHILGTILFSAILDVIILGFCYNKLYLADPSEKILNRSQ
jgi:hypothetical protein